jgi:hypothetical protein
MMIGDQKPCSAYLQGYNRIKNSVNTSSSKLLVTIKTNENTGSSSSPWKSKNN